MFAQIAVALVVLVGLFKVDPGIPLWTMFFLLTLVLARSGQFFFGTYGFFQKHTNCECSSEHADHAHQPFSGLHVSD